MNENELKSIEQSHVQAALGFTTPKRTERELVKQVPHIAVQLDRAKPAPRPNEPPTIHYAERPRQNRTALFTTNGTSTGARLGGSSPRAMKGDSA
jgi:hypothetical protein